MGANGETEPVAAADNPVPAPTQNTNAPPQPAVPPNPTIDDSKTTATVEPGTVSGTKVQPTATNTAAPLKKATKPKRKHKTTHHD